MPVEIRPEGLGLRDLNQRGQTEPDASVVPRQHERIEVRVPFEQLVWQRQRSAVILTIASCHHGHDPALGPARCEELEVVILQGGVTKLRLTSTNGPACVGCHTAFHISPACQESQTPAFSQDDTRHNSC